MIKGAEIFDFDWIRNLFNSKLDIPIKLAYTLAVLLKNEEYHPLIKKEAEIIIKEKQASAHFPNPSVILKRLINLTKPSHQQPFDVTLLEIANKSVITCRRDANGKVYIFIGSEAKTMKLEEINQACLKAIQDYLFS